MTRNKTLTAVLIISLLVSPATLLAGKGSKRWAGRGAAGGAILGLLIGGDLGGAAVGAAVGAAGGALGGAASDSSKKKAEKAELEELRQKEAERQAYDLPQTEEEWIAAIGQDNTNALSALVDCEHDRAALLAKAGATSSNPDFALVGNWIEALVALDRRDQAALDELYPRLIELDDDIDTVQQASLAADQAILEVRAARRDEDISCKG